MAQVPLAFEEPTGATMPSPPDTGIPTAVVPEIVSNPPPGMARCSACRSFQARTATEIGGANGWCNRFHVETWSEPLFICAGYVPADALTVALHRRGVEVVQRLKAKPALRYSWDVENATPAGPASSDVSVMLGIRQGDGTILTGALRIPGDRWDMGAFMAALDGEARP